MAARAAELFPGEAEVDYAVCGSPGRFRKLPGTPALSRCEARVVRVDEEMVVDHLHAGGVTYGADNRSFHPTI